MLMYIQKVSLIQSSLEFLNTNVVRLFCTAAVWFQQDDTYTRLMSDSLDDRISS